MAAGPRLPLLPPETILFCAAVSCPDAVFIYGMNLMSESLQKAAGEKMKSILALLTKNRIMGVIAGVSYEFIRLAGRSDNAVVNLLSKPGLWLQGLTTKEPDDEMIEVGIASVEAVFDWKPYVEEIRREMK